MEDADGARTVLLEGDCRPAEQVVEEDGDDEAMATVVAAEVATDCWASLTASGLI